jgi:hypothetical protein
MKTVWATNLSFSAKRDLVIDVVDDDDDADDDDEGTGVFDVVAGDDVVDDAILFYLVYLILFSFFNFLI